MKLTINRKILLGFGVITLVMIIANGYVLLQLENISSEARTTLSTGVRSIDIGKRLRVLLYDQEGHANKYLVSRDTTYFRLFRETDRRMRAHVDSLHGTGLTGEEHMIVLRLSQAHDWFSRAIRQHHDNLAYGAGEETRADSTIRADTLAVLHNILEAFIADNEYSVNNALATVETSTKRSLRVALTLTIAALGAAIALSLIIARTITRPIGKLIAGTGQIARGSFDPVVITSRDEIAQLADAVNVMSSRLKQLNDLKADLMHQIAHELRTPLQTILSIQGILSEQKAGPLTPQQDHLLHTLRASVNKLLHFTHQILDIERIKSGRMEYRFARANMLSIVTPAVEEARFIAERKNISVSVEAEPVPPAMIDAEKMGMVVSNLLSNAIKFSDTHSEIVVRIGKSKQGIRLAVEDSGAGIPAKDLPHVFTKFYQANNTAATGAIGSGIGLALVKAHVEGHGGRVYVRSTQGEGSTFIVEIPAANEEPSAVRRPAVTERV